MNEFTLISKSQLTHDVYELVFQSDKDMQHVPGQFVTFILPDGIGGRSYSLLGSNDTQFTLIIKRVADGKKGSIYLCDTPVGSTLKGVGPVGKFVLHTEHNTKLFAGTGTGIVPLYNQIVATLSSGNTHPIHLLFGVRTTKDVFYEAELKKLQENYSNFSYTIALSREEKSGYKKGYITDFVDDNVTQVFEEAYLCGAPVVVDAMQELLLARGFSNDAIYTEKY